MRIKDAKWEMTDDYIGMKPLFDILCNDCMNSAIIENIIMFEFSIMKAIEDVWQRVFKGEFDMILREMFCSPLPSIGIKAHHNDMHYKCAKKEGCDRVKVFGVPIDREYYEELIKRRKGKARVQPREQWEKNEELRQQLKNMGYL